MFGLMMDIGHSICFMTILFRYILSGIPFKRYLSLSVVSTRDLMHPTRPSLMTQVGLLTEFAGFCHGRLSVNAIQSWPGGGGGGGGGKVE